MSKDLYKILGITKDADGTQIKKAYRKMAMKYHPDKNPDDAEADAKFKDVAEAYEILSDPTKKARYDQMGYNAYSGGAQQGGFRGGGFAGGFSDLFDQIRRQQENERRVRNYTITQKIKLTMEDVYHGVSKTFKYKRLMKCDSCNGKGGDDVVKCDTCSGNGIEYTTYEAEHGKMRQSKPCTGCDGRGFKISFSCDTCKGEGFSLKEDSIEIDIPHSIMPNQHIGVTGKGHFYIDGDVERYADLVLLIEVDESESTIIENFGLITKVDLPYETLVLGGEFKFKTIDGSTVKVPVTKLTRIGHKLRLKGKGLKFRQSDVLRGDQYIMVDLKFPTEVSEEEEEILKMLKKTKE
jgi:molecular chaperone DnaJ